MSDNNTQTTIRMPILIWAALVADLERRGKGRRESGAFVLGRRKKNYSKVTCYLCYDDLDPTSLTGGVDFHASGYAALWEHCRKHKLEVLFDVHTHPNGDVRQSEIDRTHPMIPQVDHFAIILPQFGKCSRWSLSEAGIYVYQGNFRWQTLGPGINQRRIRLSLW